MKFFENLTAPHPSSAEPTERTLFGDALVAANEKTKKAAIAKKPVYAFYGPFALAGLWSHWKSKVAGIPSDLIGFSGND
jgi:hypothetical protein